MSLALLCRSDHDFAYGVCLTMITRATARAPGPIAVANPRP
jgi:hypothetical protein